MHFFHIYDSGKCRHSIMRLAYAASTRAILVSAMRVRRRYTAEQIAWAEFVLFGGSYHGCDPVGPWADGILQGSVTRDAFESWCAEMAACRPERRARAMSDIAMRLDLSLATFNRYVSGAARMIAKELNRARVVV